MRLKRALSQIKPSDGQREKIYGDILDKLSEEPPEEEKETRFVVKKRKILTSVAAALAAIVIVGGTVYAASPEVRETVNNILGINRQSTEEFYEIRNAEGNSSMETAGINAIEDGVTVTENDFTEFAEGIRAKLVSVTNTGTFVELLLEFEFDEPVKAEYYAIDYLNFNVPEAVREQTYSYGYGSLTVSDNGRIYGEITMDFPQYIPEGEKITLEINALSDLSEGILDGEKKIIEGYYRTDFVIGSPVKSYSVNVEPTEISWTQPYMGDAVAKMELSGLSYSPKNIKVDLRMLEDCFVEYRDDHVQTIYLNATDMFYDYFGSSDILPLEFKMSDGTLKNVRYSDVHSNAVMEFDMSEFETEVNVPDENSPTVTTVRSDEIAETPSAPKNYDRFKWSQDIPNDRPATVTFEFWGIMDYTDVEAIVFCGKEIPITEKDF